MTLRRKVLICLSKGGGVKYASAGTKAHHALIKAGYLPVASVNTPEEAIMLLSTTCRRSYEFDEWVYKDFDGNVDSLIGIGREFESIYKQQLAKE